MKEKIYRINGSVRRGPGLSIDEVTKDGKFICQVAYYYKSSDAAMADLKRIATEDKAEGWTVRRFNGITGQIETI